MQHQKKYCSMTCSGKARRKEQVEYPEQICALEGCENHLSKVQIKNKFNFCSRKCAWEYQRGETHSQYGKPLSEERKRKISNSMEGEKSWRWRGGAKKYQGTSWKPQRRKALDRDGHVCRKCGGFESNGKGISVHHIIRFGNFGKDRHEEANALDNLITLCQKCHYKLENKPKKCKKLLLPNS